MKRIWKWLGLGAIALGLAAGALVLFAPVGGFKAPLEAAVTAATGRTFQISGPLSLALAPELALDLGPVTLSAGKGEETPLIEANQAVLGVSFLPLLSGEARPTSLTLRGAKIVFTADGARWRFEPAAGEPPLSPFDAIAFGDLRLIDSQIVFGEVAVEARDVRLRWPHRGQSLSISGDVGFRGAVFALEAVIERRDALMQGGRVPLRIDFKSDLAEGSLDGIADLGKALFEGGVSVSAPSTRALAAFLGVALPGERVFGELSLSASLRARPGDIQLSDARFALGDITGGGTIAVKVEGDRPAINGAVSVDRLDLADWFGFAERPESGGWRDAGFDLAALAAFDAEMTVRARAADLIGLQVQTLNLTFTVRAGRLWARIDNAIAYAGTIRGTVTAQSGGVAPAFTVALTAEGFDAQSAFAAAFDGSGLTGRGDAKLDITAAGATRTALIASLAGRVDLAVIDGTLDGVDPALVARTAADEGGPQGVGPELGVSFKRLSGRFDIQNGRARSSDLRLVTNHLKLSAAGAFDMPARMLAIRARPAFAADVDGSRDPADEGRLAMPFAVTGAWGAPKAQPDWPALVAALDAGEIADADLDRLPEQKRAWIRELRAAGTPPPWPDGIEPPDTPHWQPW